MSPAPARSVEEEPYGFGHGAHAEVVAEWRGNAEPLERVSREAEVESSNAPSPGSSTRDDRR